MKSKFLEKLANRTFVGSIVSMDSPDIAEILALAGADWLFIDLEHTALDVSDLKNMGRAAKSVSPDCAIFARVPLNDTIWLKRVLDAGCDGVIIPQICSVADAVFAVSNSKYRPVGTRGVGIGRAQGYGANQTEYLANANDNILTIIQIEHIDAVNVLDDILKVTGIDGVFIGPYDLSDSLGVRGELEHPSVAAAVLKVRDACIKANIPVGIFAGTAEIAKSRMKEGYSFIVLGTDTLFLTHAARTAFGGLHG